jgi:hypothetical protein
MLEGMRKVMSSCAKLLRNWSLVNNSQRNWRSGRVRWRQERQGRIGCSRRCRMMLKGKVYLSRRIVFRWDVVVIFLIHR